MGTKVPRRRTSGPGSRLPQGPGSAAELLFAQNPVLTLETWVEAAGGHEETPRVWDQVKYYCRTGRLRRVARGVYAVVPLGMEAKSYVPDPYLVAAALRSDAVLSHHSALDLHGVSRSIFHRYPYLTSRQRRTVRLDGHEWVSLSHPRRLVRAGKVDLGVMTMDRRGVLIRVTGRERTLVDGFLAPDWAGGLEEHVASAAAFQDLDLELVDAYLVALGLQILHQVVGWFLERHPEVAEGVEAYLHRLESRVPKQPTYLGPRVRGGRLEKRWNLVVPENLTGDGEFGGRSG